jgi:succinate dehydrogenase flavin-adding protein (antitoxin of CptAB toxin-antitoxin module)
VYFSWEIKKNATIKSKILMYSKRRGCVELDEREIKLRKTHSSVHPGEKDVIIKQFLQHQNSGV